MKCHRVIHELQELQAELARENAMLGAGRESDYHHEPGDAAVPNEKVIRIIRVVVVYRDLREFEMEQIESLRL